jgi:CubicO group peptidase (beta-lactamase class C family)
VSNFNPAGMHAAMRAQVDQGFLSGVSTTLLRGREVVDRFCCGHADREANTPLREDHLFRVFSNTKLFTSCAAMLLWEEGRFQLDDPVGRYIPELADLQVLKPGATRLDDTEPARSPITVRQLMAHTSGLTYGIFDPTTVLAKAYAARAVLHPAKSLAEKVRDLATLPLALHPGTRWEYSVATDVLGHLIEVLSGQRLGEFFNQRIFTPLGLVDTGFHVPGDKLSRFATLYVGVNIADPTQPGLLRADHLPYPGAYLSPVRGESGGGGLVSTLGDMTRMLQALMPGGPTLLKPDTLKLMNSNQLPPDMWVEFPNFPKWVGRGFGLGSSVVVRPGPLEPASSTDEVNWGGLAGTIWWINPRLDIVGVLMTQRYFGQGNPYGIAFKREAYRAFGHD